MKAVIAVVFLAAGALVAGCASSGSANSDPPEEKEYSTGSNIPKRTRENADVKVYAPQTTNMGDRPQNLPPSRGAP